MPRRRPEQRRAKSSLPLPNAKINTHQLDALYDASTLKPEPTVPQPPTHARAFVQPFGMRVARPSHRRLPAAQLPQEFFVPNPSDTPAYRRLMNKMLANPSATDQYDEMILRYSRIYRLDSRLLKSIVAAESEFNPRAVSQSGAIGLMQVMPATSELVGVSASRLHEPLAGVRAGARYLHGLFRSAWQIYHLRGVRYTDAPEWIVQRIIAAYHAGPKFLVRRDLHESTRAYLRRVALFYRSKITDLRRPVNIRMELPDYRETVALSGGMY